MVYYRKTYKKSALSKTATGKKPLNMVEKKQVVKIAKQIALRDEDLKIKDISNGVLINNGGTVLNLSNGISQGTSDQNRIGDEIFARRLELRMSVKGGLNQTGYANVRVAVVKDNSREFTGTPLYGAVFESAQPESPYLYTAVKAKRWTVLFDKYICVAPSSVTSATNATQVAQPATFMWQFDKKLNHRIEFNQSSVQGRGSLYLVLITDLGTNINSTNPIIDMYSRLSFTDA